MNKVTPELDCEGQEMRVSGEGAEGTAKYTCEGSNRLHRGERLP